MPRGLDHIVHAVRDLDAAVDFYRRAGFTVGARNRHPPLWGTQNHIVQLPGTFIELLAMADTSAIAEHGPRAFSFGAFNRDFLARDEGLSMLVLEGRGSADAEEFRAAGIGDFDLFEFERDARRPDGTPIKVAFALAFASDPHAPDVGFFTCQHRHPENFWNPAFQVHANTAAHVAGVVLVADNPADHSAFLAALTDQSEVTATSAGIVLKTRRGEVAVMTPAAFRDQFSATPPPTSRGMRLAALRVGVRDMAAAERTLEGTHLPANHHIGRLVIGPEVAMGATLVFERI
jgi:catechol 2,3-dioxygenase-like lactoylglutathione lyase family enzyme